MAYTLAVILTLAFVAGISAQIQNEDANDIMSYGEPIVINLDSLPSDKIETAADRQTRASLIVGSVACDVRVYYGTVFRAAANNQIQVQDYTINAPANRRISYIAAIERLNHLGSVRILNGGIGSTFVGLRYQSAVSRPIDYTMEVWSR